MTEVKFHKVDPDFKTTRDEVPASWADYDFIPDAIWTDVKLEIDGMVHDTIFMEQDGKHIFAAIEHFQRYPRIDPYVFELDDEEDIE